MKYFTYSIVIPTYNHFELTRNCWYSVRDNTDLNNAEIIFVDNGSTDETKNWILAQQRAYKNIVFLSYAEAIGGGNAYSIGFDISRSDYLVALNNDTVVMGKNWLDILREPFLKQKDGPIAITGPVKLFSQETNAEFIVLFCAMIPRKIWKSVGGFMDMGPGYGEDIDWCRRAIDKGYKVVRVGGETKVEKGMNTGDFPIYHAGEATVHDDPDWSKITEANREKLRMKWGTNSLKREDNFGYEGKKQ